MPLFAVEMLDRYGKSHKAILETTDEEEIVATLENAEATPMESSPTGAKMNSRG